MALTIKRHILGIKYIHWLAELLLDNYPYILHMKRHKMHEYLSSKMIAGSRPFNFLELKESIGSRDTREVIADVNAWVTVSKLSLKD